MSPRERTLCFVLIFLSFNNGLVFVAGLPMGPVLTEYYPSSASSPQLANPLSTLSSPNRVFPEVPQKAFPTQRFNEVFSFTSCPQGLAINTVPTSNCGIPRHNPFTTYSTYLPPAEISNTLTIVDPITETLSCPSDIESLTIIENYPSVAQTNQVEGFAPTANVAEIYQTPMTVQIPSMPQLSPFICSASPFPEIFSSPNVIQEICTPNVLLEPYPRVVKTKKPTVTSLPVEATTLNIPSCDSGYGGCGQQLPVSLQINMASPWIPEPMIAVISQPAPVSSPFSSFDYPFSPVPPIIVMEKSKSKWKSILTILMLTLFDSGCGNNSGGGGCSCSQCSTSTPIPFPIVIPTSNPIITRSRGKGKSKGPVKPVTGPTGKGKGK